MLTAFDDHPVHQTPDPIARAGGHRNFYDRYWFQGQLLDTDELAFGAGVTVYPGLGLIDAHINVRIGDKHVAVMSSRPLKHGERTDLSVGAFDLSVVEPMYTLRLNVEHKDISAHLVFTSLFPPHEETRHTYDVAGRLQMDATRFTQAGRWTGEITVGKKTFDLHPSNSVGIRDRSWGIRNVGAPDSQPPARDPQFWWLWTPLVFPDAMLLTYRNDDATGRSWNYGAALVTDGLSTTLSPKKTSLTMNEHRRVQRFETSLHDVHDQHVADVSGECGRLYSMRGLGYLNPAWGQGVDHGGEVTQTETYTIPAGNPPFEYLHVQARTNARLTIHKDLPCHAAGSTHTGIGLTEQLFLGKHAKNDHTGLPHA